MSFIHILGCPAHADPSRVDCDCWQEAMATMAAYKFRKADRADFLRQRVERYHPVAASRAAAEAVKVAEKAKPDFLPVNPDKTYAPKDKAKTPKDTPENRRTYAVLAIRREALVKTKAAIGDGPGYRDNYSAARVEERVSRVMSADPTTLPTVRESIAQLEKLMNEGA